MDPKNQTPQEPEEEVKPTSKLTHSLSTTASITLSLSTILPTPHFLLPPKPTPTSSILLLNNKVKIPFQISSLSTLSLFSPSKQTHFTKPTTFSPTPLQNPLQHNPKRSSDPSNGAAIRRSSIVWFRNDLRVHDNEVLNSANNESMSVLPVFCFDPRDYGKSSSGFDKTGPYRANFLIESVSDLRKSLQSRGSDLVVRIGNPVNILVELAKAIGADAVYAHREVAHDEVKAEEKIENAMKEEGVEVKYFWGSTLFHVDDLPFSLEDMPLNYGGFKGRVKGLEIRNTIQVLDDLKGMPSRGDVEVGDIPTLLDLGLNPNSTRPQDGRPSANASLVGGETEALQRLQKFTSECLSQPKNGNKDGKPDSIYGANFSCKISPWLTMGCLSPRFMFDEIKKSATRTISNVTTRKDNGTGSPGDGMNWLMFELLWRDFFRFITKKYSTTRKIDGAPVTACTGTFIMDISQGAEIPSQQEENPTQLESDLVNNSDVNGTPTSTDATVTKPKRKLTSDVWSGFNRVSEPDPNNPQTIVIWAKCKICGENKATGGNAGTSHLRRHTISCMKRRRIEKSQTTISVSGQGKFTTFQFNQARARKNVIKLIILRELPFQFVEDPIFQWCINESFHPNFRKFSRNTLRTDIHKYYLEEKQQLKSILLGIPGKISLTSDIWLSKQRLSYLGITAHFIDKNWVMQKRIISYALIDTSHTGDNIADLIFRKLSNDFGISEKLFSLSMDNASANTVSIARLKKSLPNLPCKGDLFHVRCCCHILNLVVQDGLKVKGFTDMLDHIKGSLKYIFMSGVRCTQFRLLCTDMGVKPKKLQLDVKHRWNSTYLMLKDAVPYRAVLSAFLTDRSCFHSINDSDWEHAEVLCAFLKPFYDATNFFSGVNYVTSNSVLQYLYEIGMVFNNYRDNPFFKETIFAMEEKFVKYWGETPLLFGICSILDPRLNLRGVETTLYDIEECFGTSAFSIRCHADQSRLMDAKLKSLFAEYSTILHDKQVNVVPNSASTSTCTSVRTVHSSSSSEVSSPSDGGSFWAARNRHRRDPLATSSEELKRYYAEPEPVSSDIENFDVLDWWKSNEKRYPVLSCIARDVLAVQASTVASESAFSLGKRILGDYRSSLTPDMLECSVILKDWWKAEMEDIFIPIDPLNDDITAADELERLAT